MFPCVVWVLRIVTYDEIDPEQAMLLDLVCFGSTISRANLKLRRRLDIRIPDYYGICAVDDDGRLRAQTPTRERSRVA